MTRKACVPHGGTHVWRTPHRQSPYTGRDERFWFPCVMGQLREMLPPAKWAATGRTLQDVRDLCRAMHRELERRLSAFVRHAPSVPSPPPHPKRRRRTSHLTLGGSQRRKRDWMRPRTCQPWGLEDCQYRAITGSIGCPQNTPRRRLTCALGHLRAVVLDFLAAGRAARTTPDRHAATHRLSQALRGLDHALGPGGLAAATPRPPPRNRFVEEAGGDADATTEERESDPAGRPLLDVRTMDRSALARTLKGLGGPRGASLARRLLHSEGENLRAAFLNQAHRVNRARPPDPLAPERTEVLRAAYESLETEPGRRPRPVPPPLDPGALNALQPHHLASLGRNEEVSQSVMDAYIEVVRRSHTDLLWVDRITLMNSSLFDWFSSARAPSVPDRVRRWFFNRLVLVPVVLHSHWKLFVLHLPSRTDQPYHVHIVDSLDARTRLLPRALTNLLDTVFGADWPRVVLNARAARQSKETDDFNHCALHVLENLGNVLQHGRDVDWTAPVDLARLFPARQSMNDFRQFVRRVLVSETSTPDA